VLNYSEKTERNTGSERSEKGQEVVDKAREIIEATPFKRCGCSLLAKCIELNDKHMY
jgi:hypothetical protein